ncbi:hypothetical protein [Hymenobacter segetis]|uniref:Uncharacterized protein n=1 Tax=Hymenobacter segetis TaxID=2025509 RepID=A0ABU9LR49_9BACT
MAFSSHHIMKTGGPALWMVAQQWMKTGGRAKNIGILKENQHLEA